MIGGESWVGRRLIWRLAIWCLKIWCAAALRLLIAAGSAHAQTVETMKAPTFGTVTIYSTAPAQGPPKSVVLFISGDGGWNLGVVPMAKQLRDAGALVAGIDIRPFMKSLNASSGCAYPAGALEELSRAVQMRMKVPAYQRPILVGYSSGATLVYAAIAAAPPETFAGAISLGFCPDLEIKTAAVSSGRAHVDEDARARRLRPGAVSRVDGAVDGAAGRYRSGVRCERHEGVRRRHRRRAPVLAAARRPWLRRAVAMGAAVPRSVSRGGRRAGTRATCRDRTRPRVADLSLVEVPADVGRRCATTLAIVITGDGGWASLDKQIAASLAAEGVPVVGWSSLDYYWKARTPEGAAADLARIISHYTAAWHKTRVRIVGYSFGADVASFLVNRLPDALKQQVAAVVLLAPSPTATFEFHLTDWIRSRADSRYPTAREIAQVRPPVTCVAPRDEKDSVCLQVKSASLRAVTLGGGHHFGGDYKGLADSCFGSSTAASRESPWRPPDAACRRRESGPAPSRRPRSRLPSASTHSR